MTLDFLRPVVYGNYKTNFWEKALEIVDSCCYLGGDKAYVVTDATELVGQAIKSGQTPVKMGPPKSEQPWYITAVKIVFCYLLIIPVLMKFLLRCFHAFTVIVPIKPNPEPKPIECEIGELGLDLTLRDVAEQTEYVLGDVIKKIIDRINQKFQEPLDAPGQIYLEASRGQSSDDLWNWKRLGIPQGQERIQAPPLDSRRWIVQILTALQQKGHIVKFSSKASGYLVQL